MVCLQYEYIRVINKAFENDRLFAFFEYIDGCTHIIKPFPSLRRPKWLTRHVSFHRHKMYSKIKKGQGGIDCTPSFSPW